MKTTQRHHAGAPATEPRSCTESVMLGSKERACADRRNLPAQLEAARRAGRVITPAHVISNRRRMRELDLDELET